MTHGVLWSKRVRAFLDGIGIWKCWFLRKGENRSTRREPRGKNQQKNQLAYGIRSNPGRTTWSRNQWWNCTHFRHPTDEQLRHVDIYFLATKMICSLSTLNWWEESALTTAPPLLSIIALLQWSVCRFMIFYKCLGWAGFVTSTQSQEKERAHAGLTSDISIVSLAFDGKTFSRLKFLHLPRLFFDSNIQLNKCWTLWFILLFLTDFSLKRYLH